MSSKIKVDNITDQGGNNMLVKCGSTLTIGATGNTISLAAGASQTGFGRTGTVDWITTVQTSGFTAANGKGYFVNTTSGAIAVNLPAGSAGDIVAFRDYAGTWDTSPVTLTPNGSDKINGFNDTASLDTESQSVTLIFVDSTRGWLDIHDSTSGVTGSTFITATGGTITTVCTNFKVHTFTGPGTFCVSAGQGPKAEVDYVVVGGGGGGVYDRSGGGGAGGYREAKTGNNGSYTASPLANPVGIQLSPGPYSITVGGGGAAINTPPYSPCGNSGSNSVFSTINAAGGGGGGRASAGADGGSGGGAGAPSSADGGAGNVPSVSPPQGNPGGTQLSNPPSATFASGGGGGATAAGAQGSTSTGGAGGDGATNSINGTPTARAGGGGGQGTCTAGPGGAGGGGNSALECSGTGQSGTANTGGGAGGGGSNSPAGSGGSGIVIIRYRFQ